MSNLEELLTSEFNMLQGKMYKCKTIHTRYRMRKEHIDFLLKQSILSIYAEWEGFVKKVISLYLQEINKERLTYNCLHENYISYQTDQLVKFKSPKINFGAVKKITKNLYSMYQGEVVFSTNVNTESNANLKIVNSILEKLLLGCIGSRNEKGLNKLLRFRNSIAHGDEGIPVNQNDVDYFTLLIQDLASDLLVCIVDGFEKKVYLSHNIASSGQPKAALRSAFSCR